MVILTAACEGVSGTFDALMDALTGPGEPRRLPRYGSAPRHALVATLQVVHMFVPQKHGDYAGDSSSVIYHGLPSVSKPHCRYFESLNLM